VEPRVPISSDRRGVSAAPSEVLDQNICIMRAVRRFRITSLDVLLSGAAILVIAAPLLFTRKGFQVDFTNHLWLAWVAGKALVQAGHPTYFINTSTQGVFNPWFAFYGGTLYMVTGAISELLGGHPVTAYVGVTMLAIAGCYLGTLWLARQFGLRGWIAHTPALTVVTSAYYITNLYGRGAWPEFVAVSSIPPLIAGGVWLTRSPAWRPWPVLVFVVSAVIFTGSHNITLLWGTTISLVSLLILWLVLGRPRQLPYRRLAMVVGLGVAATLVNAWFLLTDITHLRDVGAHLGSSQTAVAHNTSFFDTPGALFDPLRHVPARSTTPALYVQAPVWFLAWGLVAGLLLLRGRSASRVLRRAWATAVIVVALVLAMIMLRPFWEHLPNPFTQIQLPYRLNSYVVYAVAGLVLVSAVALQRAAKDRASRQLRLALAGVAVVSLGLCVWQQWARTPVAYKNRSEVIKSPNVLPRGWYDDRSYLDTRAPMVVAPPGRTLTIPPSQVKGDHFAAVMNVPPGPQPIQTNIGAGDYLVRIAGMERVGQDNRYTVVRRVNGGSGPVHLVVETAPSRAIRLGWGLSILATLSILAALVATGVRTYRNSRDSGAVASAPRPDRQHAMSFRGSR
jgi:hypothetical protein